MTISFGAFGSAINGNDSVVVPMPAGITAGVDFIGVVVDTNPDLTPPTPTGYFLINSIAGGLGSGTASGSGPRRVTLFGKVAAGSDPSVTVNCTGASISARSIRINRASNKSWAYATFGGTDLTADGDWTVVSTNPLASVGGIRDDDMIYAFTTTNSNFANNVSWSAQALSASGCTFGATEREESASVGNMNRVITEHMCSAGQSLASITYNQTAIFGNATGSASTKCTGVSVFLLLREVDDGVASGEGESDGFVTAFEIAAAVAYGEGDSSTAAMGEEQEAEDDPPMVIIHSPSPGARIVPGEMISFTIVDDTGFGLVLPMICFPDGRYEVIHDGEAFTPDYLGSIRTEVVADVQYRYDVIRVGGFPRPSEGQTEKEIKLVPFAADLSGQAPAP